MNIKQLTLIALTGLSFFPVMAQTATPTTPLKTQPIAETAKLGIAENAANEIRSFFTEKEARRIKSLLKSMIFLGGAYSTRKLIGPNADCLANLTGGIIGTVMGLEALNHGLDALFCGK